MNTHFISRSGTHHVLGSSDNKLHGGRLVALCGFSQSPDEEPPGAAIQVCAWCLEAEERARRAARAALETVSQPQQEPEASA
jgi:hypothetical protein